MVVFKVELRRHRTYILGWAVALGVCILMMEPAYFSMMNAAGSTAAPLLETMGNSDFFRTVGIGMDFLTTPLGMYGFLTSFFMVAAGIFGMHFGISIFTRECTGGTAEYLFTKPRTRGSIFWSKAAAVFCGVLTVGGAYFLASLLDVTLFHRGYDLGEFLLIFLSLPLLAAFFAALGLLVGVLFPGNRSPLLTAGLVIFAAYCITSFSRVVGSRSIGFLSPFSFFNASEYVETGFYAPDYVAWYAFLVVSFLTAAYGVFLKKDVRFRA